LGKKTGRGFHNYAA
ncbi:hypothetical protein, partial [Frankia sp. CpI1-P]